MKDLTNNARILLKLYAQRPKFELPQLTRAQRKAQKEFFTCRCPKDLANGVGGFFHLVPIHCDKTKKEAAVTRSERIKYLRKEIAIQKLNPSQHV